MRISSRIVIGTDEGSRHEGDQRHLAIGLEEPGFMEGSSSVSAPKGKEDNRGGCRGLVVRLKYLGTRFVRYYTRSERAE